MQRSTKSAEIIDIFVKHYEWQLPCLLSDTIDQYRQFVDMYHNSKDEKKIEYTIQITFRLCDIFQIGYVLPPTYLLCLLQAKDIIDSNNDTTFSKSVCAD